MMILIFFCLLCFGMDKMNEVKKSVTWHKNGQAYMCAVSHFVGLSGTLDGVIKLSGALTLVICH